MWVHICVCLKGFICFFKKHPAWVLNKDLSAKYRIAWYKLLVRESPEAPQITQVIALGCIPQLDATQYRDPITEDTTHFECKI